MTNRQSEIAAIINGSTQIETGLGVGVKPIDLSEKYLPTQTQEVSLPQNPMQRIVQLLDEYHFNDKVEETALGTEMRLVIPKGKSFKDLFNAINEAYKECATEEQKRHISQAIYRGALFEQAGVSDEIDAEGGLEISGIPMVKGSTMKTIEKQMNQGTGRLKDVRRELYGMSKLEIAAIAALKLLKSVSEEVLVIPGKAEGNALEGKASRALGRGYVHLSNVGIFALDCHDNYIGPDFGCAGSDRSPAVLSGVGYDIVLS